MTAINSDDPQHREDLVNSGHLFFDDSQAPNGKSDLLDGDKTQDALIELLQYMVAGGWNFEVTSVNTDHSYDGNLGPHCHNPCGYCVDGWPIDGPNPGAYLDASTQVFRDFLAYMAGAPTLNEIGLAGSAATVANFSAAGNKSFTDSGSDHIHLGSK